MTTDGDDRKAAIAEVLGAHRWKAMGINWCSCECGAVMNGGSDLTEFPADEAFRLHLADALLSLTPTQPTEADVIDWFSRSGSARINRVVEAGQKIMDGRFDDGVFE